MDPASLTVTVRQAAAMLGVGRTTLYDAIANRKAPACVVMVKVGTALRIAKAPLVAALEGRGK